MNNERHRPGGARGRTTPSLSSPSSPQAKHGRTRSSLEDQDDEESQPLTRGQRRIGEENGDDSEDEIDYVDDGQAGPFLDRTGLSNGHHNDSLAEQRRKRRIAERSCASSLKDVWRISREALPILTLSLFSLMLSGELLIHLARWPVFVKVDKLFILIPILLNLKGNLEMNLSLRLSTSANIGELDVRRTRQALVAGNLALLQVQALIVSTFAGTLAFVLGLILPEQSSEPAKRPQPRAVRSSPLLETASQLANRIVKRRIIHGHPKPPVDPSAKLRNGYFEFVLVLATGTLSASLSSAILGSFMCALVIMSRRFGINPDNVASPLAGSLGDLLTLVLMGLLGSFLVRFEGTILATIILGVLVAFCVACFTIAWRNFYVKQLLSSGWTPLLVAIVISSGAGMVLDSFVQRYDGFALLAPVITGLPGACTAIFASRISTALHSSEGVHGAVALAKLHHQQQTHPHASGSHAKAGKLRFWLTPVEGWLVPATLAFIGVGITTFYISMVWWTQQMSFGWIFWVSFVAVACIAVLVALALSHFICLYLWTRDFDPDIYCLPYVSSMVDVIGQLLLVCAFAVASALGDKISSVVGQPDGP